MLFRTVFTAILVLITIMNMVMPILNTAAIYVIIGLIARVISGTKNHNANATNYKAPRLRQQEWAEHPEERGWALSLRTSPKLVESQKLKMLAVYRPLYDLPTYSPNRVLREIHVPFAESLASWR